MIDLNSTEWKDIPDAYNHGEIIPDLIKELEANSSPKLYNESEPWFSLWSSLCHQGDVYPASFAAVPHFTEIVSRTSHDFAWDFFALPAFIEISRNAKKVQIPNNLEKDYFSAIKRLSELASHYDGHTELKPEFLRAARGMVLVGQGKFTEAEHLAIPSEDRFL